MTDMTATQVLEKQKDTLAKIRMGADLPWLPDTRRREVAQSLAESIRKAEASSKTPAPRRSPLTQHPNQPLRRVFGT